MFLAFSTSVAAAVYRVLRCTVGRNIALFASLFCIAFSGEWVTFCYNNLGSLFLLVALMLQFRAIGSESAPKFPVMAVAGMSSGLAIISYPPMALPVAASVGIALAYSRLNRTRMLVAFAIGICLSMIPIIAVAWGSGLVNLVSCAKSSANVSAEVGKGADQQGRCYLWGPLGHLLS